MVESDLDQLPEHLLFFDEALVLQFEAGQLFLQSDDELGVLLF